MKRYLPAIGAIVLIGALSACNSDGSVSSSSSSSSSSSVSDPTSTPISDHNIPEPTTAPPPVGLMHSAKVPAAPTTAKPAVKPTVKPTVKPKPVAKKPVAKKPTSVRYASCADAWAAGAAPLHRGESGYRSALDRDGDGIACETKPKTFGAATQAPAYTIVNGYARTAPVVRVLMIADHTIVKTNWPVSTAVTIWNRYLTINHIPIRFKMVTSCPQVQTTCTTITDTEADGHGAVATTGVTYAGKLLFATEIICHNSNGAVAREPFKWRTSVIMHELGHVLGMEHTYAPHSIMGGPDKAPIITPSPENMRALIKAYR
jgi:hypothetical protein